MFYDLDPSTTALITTNDIFGIFRADARTILTDDILFDFDLDVAAVVYLCK
jgi:hypothetical protein